MSSNLHAAFEDALLHQPDLSALYFRLNEDAFDFGRHSAQHGNGFFAFGGLRVVKRYQEAHLHVVLKLRARADAAEYDLVFAPVPDRVGDGDGAESAGSDPAALEVHSSRDSHRDQQFMFVGVTQAVQGPDGVIPSLVWLERAKQRHDFVRQIVAAFAGDDVVEPGQVVGDRELGLFRVDFSSENGGRVAELVEGRPQSLKRLGGGKIAGIGNGPREFDFVQIGNAVRVFLDDAGVWCLLEEGIDPFFEAVNVLLCPSEAPLRACERIRFGGHPRFLPVSSAEGVE